MLLIICPECRRLYEREGDVWFAVCPECRCEFQIEEESEDADE